MTKDFDKLIDEREELIARLVYLTHSPDPDSFRGMGGLEMARERIAIRARLADIDRELDLA